MTISTYFQGRYTVHTDSVVVRRPPPATRPDLDHDLATSAGNSLTSQLGFT